MTEQHQNPAVSEDTEDTEGHFRRSPADGPERDDAMADDTEGHNRGLGMRTDDQDGDDTEGHNRGIG